MLLKASSLSVREGKGACIEEENATPLEQSLQGLPECAPVAEVSKEIQRALSSGDATDAGIDEVRVLQQPRASDSAVPPTFDAGSKRPAEALATHGTGSSGTTTTTTTRGSSSPSATPASKAARLDTGPGTSAVRPSPAKGEQQKLEFELTEHGEKRYNICGMGFSVTVEYELTRAVGQVGHTRSLRRPGRRP